MGAQSTEPAAICLLSGMLAIMPELLIADFSV
jgi:hypothetical protein